MPLASGHLVQLVQMLTCLSINVDDLFLFPHQAVRTFLMIFLSLFGFFLLQTFFSTWNNCQGGLVQRMGGPLNQSAQSVIYKWIFGQKLAMFDWSDTQTLKPLRWDFQKKNGIFWEFFPKGGEPNSQNFCKITKSFLACQIHPKVLKHVFHTGGSNIWSILSIKVHLILSLSSSIREKNGLFWEFCPWGGGGPLFPKVNVRIVTKY